MKKKQYNANTKTTKVNRNDEGLIKDYRSKTGNDSLRQKPGQTRSTPTKLKKTKFKSNTKQEDDDRVADE